MVSTVAGGVRMQHFFHDETMLSRESRPKVAQDWQSSSRWGIVTSAQYKATEAGAEILAQGGNAVDAAVATSLALGVAEPAGSGLGGMSMMMIHFADAQKTIILEGPCRAPRKATPAKFFELVDQYRSHFSDKAASLNEEELAGVVRKSGYPAIAVPTNPAVLGYALEKFGSLPRQQIMEPAIDLAQNGYVITPLQSRLLEEYRGAIRKGNIAGLLLKDSQAAPAAGTLWKQPELARTLTRLSTSGFEDFYTGAISREIIADMQKNSGFINQDDLQNIPWPKESAPLLARFRNWDLHTMPPPGGGVVLVEMLNLFEELASPGLDPDSPEAGLLFATIIRQARRDRRVYNLGEFTRSGKKAPDLASKDYAQAIAKKLREELDGCGETTHFNAIDRFGNIVSMTQSIERSYGAKVATPELGFLYNGFMKGFKLRSKTHPHYLRPGAVSRSNACPTLILQDGKPLYTIGSTGSERMVSGIFQVLVRLLSQSPFEAVAAPRLHCTPERQVFVEAGRCKQEALDLLEQQGFTCNRYDDWSFSVGGLHLAGIHPEGYWGVAEPRRDGAALGPQEEPGV